MKSIIVEHIALFFISFFVSALSVPCAIKLARRFRIVDNPDGKIKVHSTPTPYLGGLAVYSGFMAAAFFLAPFGQEVACFLIGISILLLVGLIDDLFVLTPLQKILGEGLAILVFFKGGFSLKAQFFSEPFNVAASAFWMLLVINAFNLVDVMDGLASMLAFVSSASFFIIALLYKHYSLSFLQIVFMGAIIGFFLFNKPPARIYLGDSGALFLGGFLAGTPLLFPWSSYQMHQPYIFVVPLVFLAIPLLEVACLVVIRTALGIPFYWGSPHHFAIYLRKKHGFSVPATLGITFLFGCAGSLFATFYLLGLITPVIFFPFLFLIYVSWFFLVFFAKKLIV